MHVLCKGGLRQYVSALLSLFFWGALVFPAMSSRAFAASTELYSLVMGGSIQDVKTVNNPSMGHLLSAELLTQVARSDGRMSVAIRGDRGHIVLASPQKGGAPATMQGFRTSSITLLVNGTPLQTRGQLVGGIPYLDPLVVQQALEALGFHVLISHDSKLISVRRMRVATGEGSGGYTEGDGIADPSSSREQAGGYGGGGLGPGDPSRGSIAYAGGEGASDPSRGGPGYGGGGDGTSDPSSGGPGYAGGDMLEAVRQGSARTLQALGVEGAGSMAGSSSGSISGSSAGSSQVCAAMDRLRTLWDQTEPSLQEKSTMMALATKFQQAKENGGKLDPADVDRFMATLAGFRKKVDRRAKGTREWSTPEGSRQVKALGNDFLDTVTATLDLSQQMLAAIKKGDRSFVQRAEADMKRMQELDQKVQEQGAQFNAEVIRVRQVNGCGPATLGLPPT